MTPSAITTEADDQRVGRADVIALIAQAVVDLEPPRLAEGPMTDETPLLATTVCSTPSGSSH